MKIIMSSKPESLSRALAGMRSATVEAEYGTITVIGTVITLAHHGHNAGNACPCSYKNDLSTHGVEVIGVSHLDLDTVGGVAAILGVKPNAPSFWALAEFVDLNGAHRLADSGANAQNLARLYAWWAWNEEHRIYAPFDGSVLDVTSAVLDAIQVIVKILSGDKDLLEAGEKFRQAEAELNKASFIRTTGTSPNVVVRSSNNFVNHLYVSPSGEAGDAVVAFKQETGSITVSFANPRAQDNACAFVKSLWGEKAGGHKGIAGSPRDQVYTLEDAENVAEILADLMKG